MNLRLELVANELQTSNLLVDCLVDEWRSLDESSCEDRQVLELLVPLMNEVEAGAAPRLLLYFLRRFFIRWRDQHLI